METASYFQAAAARFTSRTMRAAVSSGPDGIFTTVFFSSGWRTLTLWPPTSITRMRIIASGSPVTDTAGRFGAGPTRSMIRHGRWRRWPGRSGSSPTRGDPATAGAGVEPGGPKRQAPWGPGRSARPSQDATDDRTRPCPRPSPGADDTVDSRHGHQDLPERPGPDGRGSRRFRGRGCGRYCRARALPGRAVGRFDPPRDVRAARRTWSRDTRL